MRLKRNQNEIFVAMFVLLMGAVFYIWYSAIGIEPVEEKKERGKERMKGERREERKRERD